MLNFKNIRLFNIKKIEFFLIWIMMLLPFYNNFFYTVDSQHQFDVFMEGTQSLVWARIANSDQNGIFSDGLLMGRCYPVSKECEGNNSLCAKRYQKEIYIKKHKIDRYDLYKSHSAFHTLLFTSINKIFNFNPKTMVNLFKFLTALINAFIFTVLITMIFSRYGIFITLFITLFLILNFWFICYGNELYMFFGFMFIPLIISWKVFESYSDKNNLSYTKMYFFITLAILFKCLLTGFEFISCSVLMVFVPIVFFSIERKWKITRFLFNNILASISIILGVVIAMVILCFQISFVDVNVGIEHMLSRFIERTAGAGVDLANEIAPERLELFTVLKLYLTTTAINTFRFIHTLFWQLLFFHILACVILLSFRKYKALIVASLVAFLASVSWLILFRQHAAVHTHLDPIIWYMPYLFFAFALVGLAVKEVGLIIIKKTKNLSVLT